MEIVDKTKTADREPALAPVHHMSMYVAQVNPLEIFLGGIFLGALALALGYKIGAALR